MKKIKLPIGNGLNLVAYQNPDKDYSFEMHIDVEDADGKFVRQIAIVRPTYRYVDGAAVPNETPYELLLDDGSNANFEEVQMPGRTDAVISVRRSAEQGMVPCHSGSAPFDLIMPPNENKVRSGSGFALCARMTHSPDELYIGLADLYRTKKLPWIWRQNIARFQVGVGALPRVRVDLFSESQRTWSPHKAYTIR